MLEANRRSLNGVIGFMVRVVVERNPILYKLIPHQAELTLMLQAALNFVYLKKSKGSFAENFLGL